MKFINKVENLRGLYKKDLYNFCTKYIYKLRKEGSEYLEKSDKGLISGGIFQIKYDFGGIKQYKFVLCLEVSKEKNNDKIVAACINIHDMTRKFRSFFFDKFFSEQIEKNEGSKSANAESPFDLGSKKNSIYQYLKSVGNNYSIQLYNIEDISDIKRVSTNILEYVLFFKSSESNSNYLKLILSKLKDSSTPKIEAKEKIKDLINKYDQLLEKFNDDSEDFHKKLQYFEKNIKLFKKQ